MKRGAVIIGVDRYNDSALRDLQAAVQGAKDVAAWAESNGFEVKCLTDEANPITFERVQEAIENFTSRTGDQRLDQLFVYFSGHGVNRGLNETWLLSKATRNQNEAVNLASTVDMARYTTGIPHIVFMSDACRSAAHTIDFHNIVGSVAVVGKLKPKSAKVDRLYAARPGDPAEEVRDSLDPLGTYEAVYTSCVLRALRGAEASVIEPLQVGLQRIGVITVESLQRYLEEAMPKRAVELKLKRVQYPDAIIESKTPLYLSQVPLPSGEQRVGRVPRTRLWTPAAVAKWDRARLFEAKRILGVSEHPMIVPELESWRDTFSADSRLVLGTMSEEQPSENAEIRVHGAGVRAAQGTAGVCEIFREGKTTRIRVGERRDGELRPLGRPVSVLVELDDGRGTVSAALPSYNATLLIDRGELASVAYDLPAYQVPTGSEDSERLRALRASVAAAARHGAFRIEDADARTFADRIRIMKGIDPTLGVYAAYAYHQIGLLDQIRSVADYMRDDLAGALLFDVAMLLRMPGAEPEKLGSSAAVPFCPMLTQGWTLLPAKQVTLPPNIDAAGRQLARSLWTLFEPEGVRLLRRALSTGELP
jgi:hypothetical protein